MRSEMWDQKKKGNGMQTQNSKPCRPIFVGGMYADREPGYAKVTKVKTTPVEPFVPHVGAITCKFVDIEESSPASWDDSKYKEMSDDEELTEVPSPVSPPKRHSRKIIVSSSLAKRLNTSIELSDDELKIIPKNNKRKVSGHVIVNKLKRPLKENPRKMNGNQVVMGEEDVPIRKKSVIIVAPKSNNIKRKVGKPLGLKVKNVIVKRNTGTLQSDYIPEGRTIRRDAGPKWEHDGFQEIIDDDDDDSEEEEEEEEEDACLRNVKSRLGALNVINDDSDASVASVKANTSRRKIIPAKSKVKQMTKAPSVVADNVDTPVVQLSDSEEWTEKVSQGLSEEKSKQSKNVSREVNRITLKSSIHKEKVETVKSKVVNRQTSKTNKNKDSLNNGKLSSRIIDRRQRSNKNILDSSFTDSSGDEWYKKNVDVRKRRDNRFYNHRNRNRHR